MNPSTENLLLHRIEVLSAQVAELTAMVRHGITPPEWVSGKVLAMALGIKTRAVEFYRYDLGVIPVDGEVCRKVGRNYEYRIEGCKQLIEEYKTLSPETKQALKGLWDQQRKEVA